MTTHSTHARPPTQCPYCAHVSPLDSKFCNACGAALHLRPCPQCGAVNDITLTDACARCDADLRPAPASPDAGADPASSDAAPDGPDAADAEHLLAAALEDSPLSPAHPPPPRLSPAAWTRLLSVGLVLILATAGGGVYNYMKRASAQDRLATAAMDSVTAAPMPMPVPAPVPVPRPTPATATATVTTAPGSEPSTDPAARDAEPLTIKTVSTRRAADSAANMAASTTANAASDRSSNSSIRAAKAPVKTARQALPRSPADRPSALIDPRPTVIGPCTDAVAALGLCAADSDNSRRP